MIPLDDIQRPSPTLQQVDGRTDIVSSVGMYHFIGGTEEPTLANIRAVNVRTVVNGQLGPTISASPDAADTPTDAGGVRYRVNGSDQLVLLGLTPGQQYAIQFTVYDGTSPDVSDRLADIKAVCSSTISPDSSSPFGSSSSVTFPGVGDVQGDIVTKIRTSNWKGKEICSQANSLGSDTAFMPGSIIYTAGTQASPVNLAQSGLQTAQASIAVPERVNLDGSEATPDIPCDAGGFSWLICPAINLMRDATELVAGLLANFLEYTPLPIGVPGNGPEWVIYKMWSAIVSIANIMLVIAFMFIIFSQATSFGISSYGIKKMLPKVLAGAILLNLSYFICAFLVDLSNLAGAGIIALFEAVYRQSGIEANAGFSQDLGNTLFAEVAVGVGLAAIVVFFFLIPVFLAFLTTFLVLAARTAIITLLVIVAPLAFAAWILPNTEQYFKKWWQLFVQMLVLYPMIMAVFGAATIASQVVSMSEVDGFDINGLVALIIQALPLFALPVLFKASAGILGRINALTATGLGKYGGSRSGAFVNDWRKQRMKNVGARMASNERPGKVGQAGRFVGGYSARRKFKLDSQKSNADRMQSQQLAQTIMSNDSFARRAAGVGGEAGTQRARNTAQQIIQSAQNEEIKAAEARMRLQGIAGDRGRLTDEIINATDAASAAAATSLMLETAGAENVKRIISGRHLQGKPDIARAVVRAAAGSGVIDKKSPDLFDFLSRADAAERVAAGTARADILAETRVVGKLQAGKMISMDPAAMARRFAEMETSANSREQALIALKDEDYGQAKPETQRMLQLLAGVDINGAPLTAAAEADIRREIGQLTVQDSKDV